MSLTSATGDSLLWGEIHKVNWEVLKRWRSGFLCSTPGLRQTLLEMCESLSSLSGLDLQV